MSADATVRGCTEDGPMTLRDGVALVDSVRRAEIESSGLAFPDHPAALYNLSGTYDVPASLGPML